MIDNSSERGYNLSPYIYTFNNPISHFDPDGNWPWETKSTNQARRFARATGGEFIKYSRSYRKRTGLAAQVNIHGTSTYYNTKNSYRRKTGKEAGNGDLSLIDFSEGENYDDYFVPSGLMLARTGVGIMVKALGDLVTMFPGLEGLVVNSGEKINADAVADDKIKSAEDSSKNEKHGDGGRAMGKAESQIAELEAQLAGASNKKERTRIKNKIRNVREDAQRKKKGEEHSGANKR